jgi:hypothetical protein
MRKLKGVEFEGEILRIVYEDDDGLHDAQILTRDVLEQPPRPEPLAATDGWHGSDAQVLVCGDCLLQDNVVIFRVAPSAESEAEERCPRCTGRLRVGEGWSREGRIYRIRLDLLRERDGFRFEIDWPDET